VNSEVLERIVILSPERRLLLRLLQKETSAWQTESRRGEIENNNATREQEQKSESQPLGARSDLPDETVRTAPFSLISDADRLRRGRVTL
jgi:hypothetical protein